MEKIKNNLDITPIISNLNFYQLINDFYSIENKKTSNLNIKHKQLIKDRKAILKYLNLDEKQYSIDVSFGKGNLAIVPWIAIFNKTITTSAQKGYYAVVLFDKTHAHVCCMYAITEFNNSIKSKKLEKNKEINQIIKLKLENSFYPEEFDLKSDNYKLILNVDNKTKVVKDYELLTWAWKSIKLTNDNSYEILNTLKEAVESIDSNKTLNDSNDNWNNLKNKIRKNIDDWKYIGQLQTKKRAKHINKLLLKQHQRMASQDEILESNKIKQEVGALGEELVKRQIERQGYICNNVSNQLSLGYDLEILKNKNHVCHLEVKTSKNKNIKFYLSANEYQRMQEDNLWKLVFVYADYKNKDFTIDLMPTINESNFVITPANYLITKK